ncbi:bifunctional 2-polyprenyl-6-hydroxyphenol methylase/3-demethylubiquinol 3-O-methyltransferase UbiG [Yimella sp. cx-51]|uniref:class I SAM-dependent methyltransferase n=1 Tax=Yimella sp. cx-51 TaxID=2770551 RepID=UPI00165E02C8|nr:class I SAM-dependent methyltransferase [Yimella sp. cx-51]MBC9958096.1 class I SAM-dependent methyltransferase [Yimella sp. cx-51]QTH38860.1 class I SAM-dependent methyltransferase [Yimella sp. cx-51]
MTRAATRWERSDHSGYGERFAQLHSSGQDIDGEARLADALCARGARVLDAGCGMGRVGAALGNRGHDAYGIDLDAALLDQAARTYPGFPTAKCRVDEATPDLLAAQGFPRAYDLIVCVGNVMILGEDGQEQAMLTHLRDLLAPQGRILVGFHTDGTPADSRVYSAAEFDADVAASGLVVDARFGTYELHPYDPAGNYCVSILRRRPD